MRTSVQPEQHCKAVGRDYESIHRTALTLCLIGETDEQARAQIPGWAGAVFPGDIGSYGLIGTLETIRQRLAAYEAAGVQELVIHFSDFLDSTHLDAVRRFGRRVHCMNKIKSINRITRKGMELYGVFTKGFSPEYCWDLQL